MREHHVPLVAPVFALLAYPVCIARLAREVVECGSGVFIVLESHALQRFVRQEADDVVSDQGHHRACSDIKGWERLIPIHYDEVLSEAIRFLSALYHIDILLSTFDFFRIV